MGNSAVRFCGAFTTPYASFLRVGSSPAYINLVDSTLLFSTTGVFGLLRKLEEIFIRSSQGAGDDYLSVLIKTLPGGGEKEALDRLKTVRLALARYIARCAVSGIES